MSGEVLALAGGVGGAKLVWGLAQVLPPERLVAVVNTGDDEEFHSLYVSPDLDTVMYTLAGLANPETGWGIKEDTFSAQAMLGRYGADTWFNLGDRDLATHIRRTQLLRQGRTLSQVTVELCQRLGISHTVAPMSDAPVHTIVVTNEGELPMQEYFVRRRCQPRAVAIRYEGVEQARPSPVFAEALATAAALVFCPSNPFLSIGPILALPSVREAMAAFRGPRLAVSPIVGGQALKGPAAKLLQELGQESSVVSVARYYQGLCDILVLDEADRHLVDDVNALGLKSVVAKTVMVTPGDKIALAKLVCGALGCL